MYSYRGSTITVSHNNIEQIKYYTFIKKWSPRVTDTLLSLIYKVVREPIIKNIQNIRMWHFMPDRGKAQIPK